MSSNGVALTQKKFHKADIDAVAPFEMMLLLVKSDTEASFSAEANTMVVANNGLAEFLLKRVMMMIRY